MGIVLRSGWLCLDSKTRFISDKLLLIHTATGSSIVAQTEPFKDPEVARELRKRIATALGVQKIVMRVAPPAKGFAFAGSVPGREEMF